MNEEHPTSATDPGRAPADAGSDAPPTGMPTGTAAPPEAGGTVTWSARQPVKPDLPGYDIIEILGRGGMGVVYKAQYRKLGRTVAIKAVLGGALAGPAALERFWREARTMAALTHAHIVTLFDIAQHGESLYMAMEYCAGGSLAERIATGPLEPRAAAELVEVLARAVHAAHQAGIVHRDLKPHNVLFTADGTPKLTDFGLAKNLNAAGITGSDAVMGTPGYMAPEQATGQSKQVGPLADVYGLGAILYAALCGRAPFEGENQAAVLVQMLTQDPPPPGSVRPGVPDQLEAICLKCLAKDSEARYTSALDLAADLERFSRGEAIAAGTAPAPNTPTTAVPGPARHRLRRRLVLAGLGALLMVGTLGGLLGLSSPQPEKVFREVISAGLALADAIDNAAPPDKLEQARERYNKAAERWKDLDISDAERAAVEVRHKTDIDLLGNRLASAFTGKSHLDEFSKFFGGMGRMFKDMVDSVGGGNAGMPKLPRPLPSFGSNQ